MSAPRAIADPNVHRTRLRVAALDQWAAAGVALAGALVSESERGLIDAARRLARIAQAVRLAVALAMRLSQPDNPAFQPIPARPRPARPAERHARADAAPGDKPRRRRGVADREISDAAILRRPLVEIVRLICRNLGVVPDWSLWTEEDGGPGRASAATGSVSPADRSRPDRVRRPAPPPGSPPRPALILDRPTGPPPTERRRRAFALSCAAAALIPTPTAPWRAGASACP